MGLRWNHEGFFGVGFFRSLFFVPPAISYCELFLPYLVATPLKTRSFQSFSTSICVMHVLYKSSMVLNAVLYAFKSSANLFTSASYLATVISLPKSKDLSILLMDAKRVFALSKSGTRINFFRAMILYFKLLYSKL